MKIVIFFALFIISSGQPFAQSSNSEKLQAQIDTLKAQLEKLQQQRDTIQTRDSIDLSGEEHTANSPPEASHPLARPWYQNLDIWGFGAFWFIDSGKDGTRPHPGFVIKETALFVEAEAWEDMYFYFELQTTSLQRDHSSSVRTGEVYAHFRNVLKCWGDDLLSIKIGRVDMPLGEEYL